MVSKELVAIIFSALTELAPFTQMIELSTILRFFKIAINNASKLGDTELIGTVWKAHIILSQRLWKYNTMLKFTIYILVNF